MNKVQKMIMSFAAVAMIVGFSAFRSESKKVKVDAWYYTLNSNGTIYTRIGTAPVSEPNPDDCLSGPSKKCYVAFGDDEGATIDATSALPAPTVDESDSNGYRP